MKIVAKLCICLVFFGPGELVIYPDDSTRPPPGQGLNLPTRITLTNMYPVDRSTREVMKSVERIKAMNYEDHLRRITEKFNGQFIDYDPVDGSWTFMVFSLPNYQEKRNYIVFCCR